MDGISWVVGTSPFEHLSALGWLIALVIGPPAVVLLWRQSTRSMSALMAGF
jgi:hypothetical protein